MARCLKDLTWPNRCSTSQCCTFGVYKYVHYEEEEKMLRNCHSYSLMSKNIVTLLIFMACSVHLTYVLVLQITI